MLRHLSIKSFVVMFIVLSVLSTLRVLYAEVNLPYEEGDWFKYRITASADGTTCWAEVKVTVLDIDTKNNRVKVRVELIDYGGDKECTSSLSKLVTEQDVTLDLDNDPRSSPQFFVDSKYSGKYDCSGFGIDCSVTYDKGVLKSMTLVLTFGGVKTETRMSLIDSSVLAYKPITTWLIVIAVISVVVVLIIFVIRIVKKATRPTVVQPTPSGTPPPPPTSPPT